MKHIIIEPNIPLYVALLDPEGLYDFELNQGTYQTTAGQVLMLPEPAVLALNEYAPAAAEEIRITKHWTGKSKEPATWTVTSAAAQEPASAPTESARDIASLDLARPHREPPTPIRAASRPQAPSQPGLFDQGRGTGTYGPAPRPRPAIARRQPPEQIPANVAVREILEFINADPGTENWSAEAKQDLVSTVLIGFYKEKHIGPWERGTK